MNQKIMKILTKYIEYLVLTLLQTSAFTGHREPVDENITSKAHHFLTKQISFYQCFSVKPDGSTSGFNSDLIEKDRQVLLKATRARNVVLSRRKDHKKRVPTEVEEDAIMTLPVDRSGQRPEVQYDVCLTCPYSVVPVDLEGGCSGESPEREREKEID